MRKSKNARQSAARSCVSLLNALFSLLAASHCLHLPQPYSATEVISNHIQRHMTFGRWFGEGSGLEKSSLAWCHPNH
eukprot:3529582-Amphidinium_carterae.1